MHHIKLYILISTINLILASKIDPVDRGYIFTSPKKILAGETESGCLSLHNLEPPAHVLLELISPAAASTSTTTAADEEILASTSTLLETGSETCLELSVPDRAQMTYSMARLRLKIRFDKYPEYHVNTEKDVYIEYDSSIVFVETDKPIYKPGQDVNIRLLALTHDLKPWKRPIPKVWIENPAEVRVAQWTNLNMDRGIVQLQFPLSPDPNLGSWRIKVEKKKSHPHLIHTTSFDVKKYVLPKFQVTVTGPSYILADADNATWTICARYSYGEPVRGTLRIKCTPQIPSWRRGKYNFPAINYETRIDARDGCTGPFTVSSSEMGLPDWEVAPNSIIFTANLTQDGTETVETATSRVVVMHQALKLEFLPHTPKYFKLGLPYHGKLRVLRPDSETPAAGEKIQLCLRVRGKDDWWARVVVECKNFTSSAMGFVNFIVPPQHRNIVLLSFVATGIEYPTKYYSPDKRWRVFMDQPAAYIDVGAWYSPSESYLAVARGDQPIVCGEKYPFNVMYTLDPEATNESIAFHYSINSKGDLLIFGHVKHKPHKDSILNYAEFKNVLGRGSADATTGRSEVPKNNIVHRFPLSVKVTPSMAPISELLLYYVRPDGETVATTYTIEINGGDSCFENRVKTTWLDTAATEDIKRAPGEVVRYNIEAAPWSLCGVSVVDSSTNFLARRDSKKSNLIDAEGAFDQTKKFHYNRGDTPALYQSVWSHCKKTIQPPETSIDEIDHLPSPAVEAPPVWDHSGARTWQSGFDRKRNSKRQSSSSSRKARSSGISLNGVVNYVDAMQAFDDFGVIVMSDLILESRPCPQNSQWWPMNPLESIEMGHRSMDEPDRIWGNMKMPQAFPLLNFGVIEPTLTGSNADVGYIDQLPGVSPRSYFPETWLWELVTTGKDGKAVIKRTLPDTITNWMAHTICISSSYGLGIAPVTKLTAFQPFFLDYSLPYSVKRGELLRMKVSLFNYMQYSLPVKIHLIEAPGFELHLPTTSPVGEYCVAPRKSIVHEYVLIPRVIGEINITVSAAVDLSANQTTCASEDKKIKTEIFTQDTIIKPILVLPEGFPIETTQSAFVCPKDFNDDSSITWNLSLPVDPENFIADSARAYVSLIGDLLGPALENLDNLVRLPFGCGEQNLILFVPNIHVINYLDATTNRGVDGPANPQLRQKAIRNMEKGYQRELNYRHPDGSYSAFGPQSSESTELGGSMWLTAFVVKSYAQARRYIHIDDRDLKLSVKWIYRKQLENGCFPVIGRIFHKDMKGGLQDDDSSTDYAAALTAYVLVALVESVGSSAGKNSLPPSIIDNAVNCLEKVMTKNLKEGGDLYTVAVGTYALALLEHPSANKSMNLLLDRSTRLHDLLWWEDKTKTSSRGLSIEMTAYAVLSLVKLAGESNMALAHRAIRWMAKQRNAEGGFTSTQDTVIGLEALAKYATAMAVTNATTDLSILVTAGDVDRIIRMHDENRRVLVQIPLPVFPTLVEVFVEGEGCVLVQTNLKYNVAQVTGSQAFDLSVTSKPVGSSSDECSMQKINVCARYKMADEESNMALLEIKMISGYVAYKTTLHALLEDSPVTRVERFDEEPDGSISIYFDKLTAETTCISFLVWRENIVEKTEPANVKLYDYYRQELMITQSYNFVCCTCDVDTEDNSQLEPIIPLPSRPELKELPVPVNTIIKKSEKRTGIPTSLDTLQDIERHSKVIADGQLLVENKQYHDQVDPNLVIVKQNDITETPVLRASVSTTETMGTVASLTSVELEEKKNDIGGSGAGDLEESEALEFESSYSKPLSSFIVIDHELDTPDGIEGPPPVYIKPSFDINNYSGNETDFTSNLNLRGSVLNNNIIINHNNNLSSQLTSTDVYFNPSDSKCPICGDKLPANIDEIYCSAGSVIKVAIRRLRRARLLLDMIDNQQPKRLRATVNLLLDDARCKCPLIDKPGSLALMIFTLGKDTSLLTIDGSEHKDYELDGLVSIYTLPISNLGGASFEIIKARSSCPRAVTA
ncbi:alpha-2-macroglobulin-like protein 1 isoform X1 [Microplitis demolitor]|uniref:alpha-2-macroglobulin-like protein 1 isoform X1 n=2 Tax=Microplitis demolitor TaxID=69319 RepID=UPI0004CCF955|nr:alpha-2-macroglobulin-like protein 1 isoform X1 [Microplitis demolitor]